MDEENFPRGGIRLDEIKEKQRSKKTHELFKDAVDETNLKGKKRIKDLQKGSIGKEEKFPKPSKSGPLFSKKLKKKASKKPWTKKVLPGNEKQNFREKKNKTGATQEDVTLKPIELLPKDIHTSMTVLGFVKEIQDYSLMMALPNGRRGQVPITNISDAYTKCLESFSNSSGETDTPDEKLQCLAELFTVGMLLPCKVMERVPSSPVPQLSINPRVINNSLSVDSLMNIQICYGSISDVEDTGYQVDLGIEDKKGFLQRKNAHSFIQKYNNGQGLKVGQSMWFRILQKSGKKSANAEKYLSLTLDPGQLNEKVQNKNMKLTELLPGMKVKGKVKQVVDKGLIVSCLKQQAVIHQSHLCAKLSSYTVGDKIECCVLYISPDTKCVTLSALPHIVNYSGEPVHLLGFGSLYIGCLVQDATVLRVKESKGVFVKLEGNVTGLADNNNIEEGAVYEKGSSHRCVVTDMNYKENKAKISFKEEKIREMAEPASLVGDIITGKVEGIKDKTVVVQVMDKFTGKVSLRHQAPGLTYAPGTELKFRVLSVSKNGRLTLTNKSWALESRYPIVTQLDQVELDQLLQGFVLADGKSHIKVCFCGKLQGIIKKEWVDGAKKMQFGDPVLCRVLFYSMNGLVVCLQENVEDFSVPENSVGMIVGPGGKNIKELQKETSTHIYIKGNMCRVCGTKDNREKAKEEIRKLVNKLENFEDFIVPKNSVGVIVGQGGKKITELEKETSTHISIKGNVCRVGGTKDNREKAKKEIMKIVNKLSEIDSSSPKLVKKRSLSESSEEASSSKKTKPSPEKESEETMTEEDEIVIRKHEVKITIGEHGLTIKEIERKSGATLMISPVTKKGKSQTFTIQGSQESILNAKHMIHKFLNKNKNSGGQDQSEEDMEESDTSDVSEELQPDPTTDYSTPKSARKRNASENNVESPDSKKIKLSLKKQQTEEIVIPKSTVGKVIGRKGSTIKEIGRKSVALIEILHAKSGEEDSKCRIHGSLESITKAKEMIYECINESKVTDTHHVTQELNIPGKYVPIVIGKAGAVVEKIKALSGAKIIMQTKGSGESGLCKISGTEQNVMKAKEWIEGILSSDKFSDSPESTQELNIPGEYAGKVFGKGGKIVIMISTLSGAKVQILDGEVEGVGRICRISGPEEKVLKAKGLIEDILSENRVSGLPHGTQELNIPDEDVGKLIGKGGKIIKKIKAKSGAEVQILDGEVEGAGKLCRISGPEENILQAKGLIEDILSSKKFQKAEEIIEEHEDNGESDMEQEPDGMVEVHIMVPSSCVQELLQNKKFKQLQNESQSKVSLDQEEEDTDTVCSIRGKEEDVMVTKKKFEKLLKKVESKNRMKKPTLQLTNSLTWDTEFKLPTTNIESSSDESDNEEVTPRPAKKTKAQIRKEKLEEEKRLYEYERKKLEGEVVPETADDFDRLVINSPDSSVVWLRYMAFHLETSEIDKARTVAERALKTISFREEGEKRNIWLAYLNLENMYGSNESIGKILARAITQCEPLDIYLPLVNMYIESSKIEEAERLYSLMVKKYSSRKEVWPKFGEFYFQQGRPDSARKLMQRSLKSLADRNHVETIIKFAQMEFKYGEPERGKTMFENVLSTYPKRTDVWSVYVDLLTKLKDHAATRGVYKRMIGLSLPAKKIKFFFKKYLEFEEKFGTEAQIAEVKQKALEYVESGGTVD